MESEERKAYQWKKVIVLPAVAGALAGFLVSYALTPQYTSRSSLLAVAPTGIDVWGPASISDVKAQLASLELGALSPNRLEPLIHRMGITEPEKVQKAYEEIRKNTSMLPSNATDSGRLNRTTGFDVTYRDSNPDRAQQVCNGLILAIFEYRRALREESSRNTIKFLEEQVGDARSNAQDLHARLIKNPSDKALARKYRQAQDLYLALSEKLDHAKTLSQVEEYGLEVVRPCGIPVTPLFPNRPLCSVVGFGAGLLVGIALITANRH